MTFRSICLSLALGCYAFASASAADALRSEVLVDKDVVTIGDFYANAGDIANKALFRAPDLGTSGTVSAAQIAERARAAGLKDAGTDGLRHVVVRRVSFPVTSELVNGLLKAELSRQRPSLSPEDLEITLFGLPDVVHADPHAANPVRLGRVDWRETSGQLSASVEIATGGKIKTIALTGRVSEMIDVVALAAPVARGEVIRAQDLTIRRAQRTHASQRSIGAVQDAVGMAAKRSLREGQLLSSIDIEAPVLVNRGEKVTLFYQIPGMTLTSRGQAMSKGAEGDMIEILNLQSRRIVTGEITARGQVTIANSRPQLASLQESN